MPVLNDMLEETRFTSYALDHKKQHRKEEQIINALLDRVQALEVKIGSIKAESNSNQQKIKNK